MIRAVLIEDEKPAADYLMSLLNDLGYDIEVVKLIDNAREARLFLSQNTVDLIFLDIHLGDADAFSIFENSHIQTPVIFTTAFNQYALRAFKVHSIDYLLKPVDKAELKQALDKFVHQKLAVLSNLQVLLQDIKQPIYQERFLVSKAQRIKSIEAGSIAYFVSEGRYSKLVTHDKEGFLINESLESLEHKLDPARFFRINRKAIISFESIAEMTPWSKSRISLKLQPAADFDAVVSVERAAGFKKWLNR